MTTGMTAMKSKEEIVALLKGSQPGFGLIKMSSNPRGMSYDDLMEKVQKQSAYAMYGDGLYYVNRDGKVSAIALGDYTTSRIRALFPEKLNTLRMLQKGTIVKPKPDDEIIKNVKGLTDSTPNTALTIDAAQLTMEDLKEIGSALSQNKWLNTLSFDNCNKTTQEMVDAILKPIQDTRNLNLLNLNFNSLSDYNIEANKEITTTLTEHRQRSMATIGGRKLYSMPNSDVPQFKSKYLNTFLLTKGSVLNYIEHNGQVTKVSINDQSKFNMRLAGIREDKSIQAKPEEDKENNNYLLELSAFQLNDLITLNSQGNFKPKIHLSPEEKKIQTGYELEEEKKEKAEKLKESIENEGMGKEETAQKLAKKTEEAKKKILDAQEKSRMAQESLNTLADEELKLANELEETLRARKEALEKRRAAVSQRGVSDKGLAQEVGSLESDYQKYGLPDETLTALTSRIASLENQLENISLTLARLNQNTPVRALGTSTKSNRIPSSVASKYVTPTKLVSEQNIVSGKTNDNSRDRVSTKPIKHEGQSGVVLQNKVTTDGNESDQNTVTGQYEWAHSEPSSRSVTPDYSYSSLTKTNQRRHSLMQEQNIANSSSQIKDNTVHVKDPQANDFHIYKKMSVLYIQSLVDKSFSGAEGVVRNTTVKPETKSAEMNIFKSNRNNVHNTVVPNKSALRFSEAELSLANTFELFYSTPVTPVRKPAVNTNGPDNDLNAVGNTLAQHSRRLSGLIQQSALNTDRTRSNMRSAFIAPDVNQSYSDSSVLSDVGFKTDHDTKSGTFRHQTQNTAQSVLEITGATGSRPGSAVNTRSDNKKPDLVGTKQINRTSSSAIPMNPTKWEKVYANIPAHVSVDRKVQYAFNTFSFDKINAANFSESEKLDEDQLKCLHDPKEGLTVTSPAGLDYSLSIDKDGIPKAVLKEDILFTEDSKEEKRKRQAVTVMNMIDNVLSHSAIVNIKSDDLFLRTIANKYIEHLNHELSMSIPVSSTDKSSSDPSAIKFFDSLKNGMLAKASLEKAAWFVQALKFREPDCSDMMHTQREFKAAVQIINAQEPDGNISEETNKPG